VNQTPHLVAEKHVHFLRFDNRHHLALSESGVQYRLSFPIFAGAVVFTSGFDNQPDLSLNAAFESADSRADIAHQFGDLSEFSHGRYRLNAFDIARRTHRFDFFVNGVFSLCHN